MDKKKSNQSFDNEMNGSTHQGEKNSSEDMRILEAILFASDELMTASRLKAILPGEPDVRRIRTMVEKINVQLQRERHPFEVVEIGGGYQFRTIAYYHPWVRKIFKEKAVKKLSIQALECLAVIAYKQPVSKAEIEAVRGVVSDGAMKTLLEKRLVTVSGRSDKPGRPLLYSTTQLFLTYFGLNKIADLPRIEEFEAMAREKMDDLSLEELNELEENDQDIGDREEMQNGTEENQSDEDSTLFEVNVEKDEKVCDVSDSAVFEVKSDGSTEASNTEETTGNADSNEPSPDEEAYDVSDSAVFEVKPDEDAASSNKEEKIVTSDVGVSINDETIVDESEDIVEHQDGADESHASDSSVFEVKFDVKGAYKKAIQERSGDVSAAASGSKSDKGRVELDSRKKDKDTGKPDEVTKVEETSIFEVVLPGSKNKNDDAQAAASSDKKPIADSDSKEIEQKSNTQPEESEEEDGDQTVFEVDTAMSSSASFSGDDSENPDCAMVETKMIPPKKTNKKKKRRE